MSTGGSVALRLAADSPEVVRRLVLVSAACTLGDGCRAAQRRTATLLAAGRQRRAGAAMMSTIGAGRVTRGVAVAAGWLLGPLLVGHGDPDLPATIEAEDRFDVCGRLTDITAPTLVVGGERDACYGRALFERTAAGIPNARLLLLPRTGHIGVTPAVARAVLDFLDGDLRT